ncbi:hypothetical protein A3C09_03230 [Candidatus Uhrbacteria bacterium RIFCSPHIGHO2_02_FULL_47_44]|uniref:Uncharacterized protein n=1 Tax=Candidatus Uhrbacteria bacterium RIFCSPLOWO2_02_FULL_48_18 TaxID=1802408 RepID=A0A1F7V7N6_9BACT|nr:MAG: hypothetical protein A3C09_03230 [Candidatus Uhrbacteria bacterium RIFCSPHIGHO2_02_FULL_47_44]OGL76986.1 MAG: hypothetical protein A3E97_05285 [Candidatus Uhrbacteria bacterium RIFCSPHIGHO2_12_FULL_47_12]OGL80752.1 MAG: hypothetical protein A3B20_05190 [Candidatus Uhrbacteria bacterium RIFCSPLOWO2_01_FULL_47_17]OGL86596.1 MAG: hypothetical protein A3I41_04910 [Candidatus Uhrbacteria bacterium RIFCSPLOWO2_02_FULL_48_18]OGL92907.1 MAG: hypothetical protein A3H12_02275 [Candidatus Uhrbacte
MTEREPGAEPPFEAEPKGSDVVVHREMTDEEYAAHKKKQKEAGQADRDAYDAERERLDKYLNPDVPPEVDEGIGGPKPKEPIWATTTYLAAKTGGVAGKVPKWLGYKGSSFLTAIETWGKDTMKKNAPWLAKIPIAGGLLLGDVKKTWEERDKEEAKKREATDKANKSAAEKAKKELDAAAKKTDADLKKQQTSENKKADQETKNYEKTLQSLMTPLEEYNYKHGDDEAKKAILETVEKDLPAREAKRKENEHTALLVQHMTAAEQEKYRAPIPAVPPEGDPNRADIMAQIEATTAAKAELLVHVQESLHTPERAAIAQANKGGGKKGKKGGGGGKGGGRGRS